MELITSTHGGLRDDQRTLLRYVHSFKGEPIAKEFEKIMRTQSSLLQIDLSYLET